MERAHGGNFCFLCNACWDKGGKPINDEDQESEDQVNEEDEEDEEEPEQSSLVTVTRDLIAAVEPQDGKWFQERAKKWFDDVMDNAAQIYETRERKRWLRDELLSVSAQLPYDVSPIIHELSQ